MFRLLTILALAAILRVSSKTSLLLLLLMALALVYGSEDCAVITANRCTDSQDCAMICALAFPTGTPCLLHRPKNSTLGCCACTYHCGDICANKGFWPCPMTDCK